MSENGRKINYLRISLTDRCNMRCTYCVPEEGIALKPQEEILSLEEISRLAEIFISLGINKIRLTGGEPLVRKGFMYLIKSLAAIPGLEELSLTTNGVLLPFYTRGLKKAGVKRINISLDTLDEVKFGKITRTKLLSQVLEGIQEAKSVGLDPIKINTVIMKGINESEIPEFIKYAISNRITLRFIEFMKATPLWKREFYVPIEDIKEAVNRCFPIEKIGPIGPSPAEYYRLPDGQMVGFIRTNQANCMNCNRLRLTSTGEVRICLYENSGLSLKGDLRGGSSDEHIKTKIIEKIGVKDRIDYNKYESTKVYMKNLGG